MMKYSIVVLAACLVGAFAELSEERIAMIKQYKAECLTETGLDESVLEAVKADKEHQLDDEKLNCFSSCMLMKSALMKADGTLDEEVSRQKMLDHLPADKVDEVLGKCKDLVGKDTCETGGKIMFCLFSNDAIPIVA